MLFAPLPPVPEPLALTIEAPTRVRSGEAFRIRAWLVNRSEGEVVVVTPSLVNGPLGARFRGALWRGDKEIATIWAGMWTGQAILPHEYKPKAFTTIAPGDRIKVEDIEFRQEYASGERPSLISEARVAPRRDLLPGDCVYRARWSFKPSLGTSLSKGAPFDLPAPTLTSEAKDLYDRAWVGEVKAEQRLTILAPAP